MKQEESARHIPATRSKVMQLLGLAQRAGQVVVGGEPVLDQLRTRRICFLFLAKDAGANTAKKVRDKCAFYNIAVNESFDRLELGRACGRSSIVVVAVADPGFATKFQQYLGEISGGEAFGETSGV
jgi:ribosomal protein L7Ae-like RNA K-turn-binding protein